MAIVVKVFHTDGYYFLIAWAKHRNHRRKGQDIKYYRFYPVIDAKDKKIGARGLAARIKECSVNPLIKDYDAPFILV